MGYADGLLSTGERIVHREKQHWFVFVWGARCTILAVVLASSWSSSSQLATDGARARSDDPRLGRRASCSSAGWSSSAGRSLRYLNQEYVLTNRRVIQVEGVAQQDGQRQLAREDQRRAC